MTKDVAKRSVPKPDRIQKPDKMMAYLALQLGQVRVAAVGPAPSDEELAAMSESALDETRRAQVLSHIASNAEVYHRWVRISETVAALRNPTAARQLDVSAGKSGLLKATLAVLFGKPLRVGVLGGGLATAVVAVLAVLLLPTVEPLSPVDQQYHEWSTYIDQQWPSLQVQPKYQKQSASSRAFIFKTVSQQVVDHGFHQGAQAIGLGRFESLGFQFEPTIAEVPQPGSVLNAEHYNALIDLGRLTALTTLQCELRLEAKDFSKAYDSYRSLSKTLRTSPDQKLANMVDSFPVPGDTRQVVCAFTAQLAQMIL